MARNSDHYAIVIGIDAYPFLRRLRASGKDAARFQTWLLDEDGGGLLPEHIATFISPATLPDIALSARPIQGEIDDTLMTWGVTQGHHVGSRLYFYFAGHAFGPKFNDVGMLMANAANGRLNSHIGLQPYREYFHEQAPFDEVVFILDCCRDRVGLNSTRGPELTVNSVDGPASPVEDFVVLAAAYGEKAFQADDTNTGERRGLLTEAVLEGLQGAARDQQGRITASMLRDYVRRRVPELAKLAQLEQNLQQEPEAPPPNKEMVFGPVVPPDLVRVRIIAPARLSGDLVVRNGTGLGEVARRMAAEATIANAPWEIDLTPNSLYLVQHTGSGREEILDTRRVKEQPYVFRFPRSS